MLGCAAAAGHRRPSICWVRELEFGVGFLGGQGWDWLPESEARGMETRWQRCASYTNRLSVLSTDLATAALEFSAAAEAAATTVAPVDAGETTTTNVTTAAAPKEGARRREAQNRGSVLREGLRLQRTREEFEGDVPMPPLPTSIGRHLVFRLRRRVRVRRWEAVAGMGGGARHAMGIARAAARAEEEEAAADSATGVGVAGGGHRVASGRAELVGGGAVMGGGQREASERVDEEAKGEAAMADDDAAAGGGAKATGSGEAVGGTAVASGVLPAAFAGAAVAGGKAVMSGGTSAEKSSLPESSGLHEEARKSFPGRQWKNPRAVAAGRVALAGANAISAAGAGALDKDIAASGNEATCEGDETAGAFWGGLVKARPSTGASMAMGKLSIAMGELLYVPGRRTSRARAAPTSTGVRNTDGDGDSTDGEGGSGAVPGVGAVAGISAQDAEDGIAPAGGPVATAEGSLTARDEAVMVGGTPVALEGASTGVVAAAAGDKTAAAEDTEVASDSAVAGKSGAATAAVAVSAAVVAAGGGTPVAGGDATSAGGGAQAKLVERVSIASSVEDGSAAVDGKAAQAEAAGRVLRQSETASPAGGFETIEWKLRRKKLRQNKKVQEQVSIPLAWLLYLPWLTLTLTLILTLTLNLSLTLTKVKILWDTAETKTFRLFRNEYFDYHLSVCHFLMEENGEAFDESDAWESAHEDWRNDSQGTGSLHFDFFLDSVFELVDLWTQNVQLIDYVRFLKRLVSRVTTPKGKKGKRRWAHAWPRDRFEREQHLCLLGLAWAYDLPGAARPASLPEAQGRRGSSVLTKFKRAVNLAKGGSQLAPTTSPSSPPAAAAATTVTAAADPIPAITLASGHLGHRSSWSSPTAVRGGEAEAALALAVAAQDKDAAGSSGDGGVSSRRPNLMGVIKRVRLLQALPTAARRGTARLESGLTKLMSDLGAEEEVKEEAQKGGGAQAQAGKRRFVRLARFRSELASLAPESVQVDELVRNEAFTLALFAHCDADGDGLLSQADLQAAFHGAMSSPIPTEPAPKSPKAKRPPSGARAKSASRRPPSRQRSSKSLPPAPRGEVMKFEEATLALVAAADAATASVTFAAEVRATAPATADEATGEANETAEEEVKKVAVHEARELMRLAKAVESGDIATAEMALRDLKREVDCERFAQTVKPAILALCARAEVDETLLDELERMSSIGGVLATFGKEGSRMNSRGNVGSEVRDRIHALKIGKAAREAAAATRAAMESAMEATGEAKKAPGYAPGETHVEARPHAANESARTMYRAD